MHVGKSTFEHTGNHDNQNRDKMFNSVAPGETELRIKKKWTMDFAERENHSFYASLQHRSMHQSI